MRESQAKEALAREEVARRASERSAREAQEAKRVSDQQAAELQLAAGQALAEAGQVDQGMFLMLRAWEKAPEQAHDLRRLIRLNLETWLLYLPRLRWTRTNAPEDRAWGFLPAGQVVRFAGNQLFLHDPATGRQLGPPQAFPGSRLMACSSDGQWVVTRTNHPDGYVYKVFDRLTAKPIVGDLVDRLDRKAAEEDLYARPYLLTLRSNPPLLWREASTGEDYDCRVWDLRTGKTLGPGCRAPLTAIRHLLADKDVYPYWLLLHLGGRVEVQDGLTGKPVEGPNGWVVPEAALRPPDLFPQRNTLQGSFGLNGLTFGLWDSRSGRALAAPWSAPRLSRLPYSYQESADGRSLATVGVDHRLRWYDLATQRPCLPGASLKYPNGSLLVSQDSRHCLFRSDVEPLWQLFEFPRRLTVRQAGEGSGHNGISAEGQRASFGEAAFSPDRQTVLLGKSFQWPRRHARLTATRDNRLLGAPMPDCDSLGLFSPSGRLVALAADRVPDFSPVVRVHDARTGQPRLPPIEIPRFIHFLQFSPDESKLAIGHVAGVHLVDLATKQITVLRQPGPITRLLFSPDATQLLVGVREGWGNQPGLRFWDVRTAQPITELFPMADAPILIPDRQGPGFTTVERDSGRLRSWGFNHPGRLEAAGLPAPIDLGVLAGWRIERMPGYEWSFSPDRRRLALGSTQGRVWQWDLQTRQRLGPEASLGRPIHLLAYSPDGSSLAVSGEEGTVLLLDAQTLTPIGPGLPLRSVPVGLAFTADGHGLLAACRDGRCVRFDLGRPVPLEQEQWQPVLEALTGVRPEGNALEVLTPAEHQQRLERTEGLRKQMDRALPAVPAGAAWHALEFQDALQAGQLNSALFHLDRWSALEPDAWLPLAWRGMIHVLEGQPGEAEADFAQAAKRKGGEEVAFWKQHLAVSVVPPRPKREP